MYLKNSGLKDKNDLDDEIIININEGTHERILEDKIAYYKLKKSIMSSDSLFSNFP